MLYSAYTELTLYVVLSLHRVDAVHHEVLAWPFNLMSTKKDIRILGYHVDHGF